VGKTGFARAAHTLWFFTVSERSEEQAKPENWRKTEGFSTSSEPRY